MTSAPAPDAVAFTVADVLALPEHKQGSRKLVAGGNHLAQTRPLGTWWPDPAVPPLDGGELVLTTGAGWPETRRNSRLTEALAKADPATVILEISTHLRTPPAALVQSCEAHGIPLVVLHREVRFVHPDHATGPPADPCGAEPALRPGTPSTMLTELGLNRSPVDYVIERLSETLRAPVVLEDSAHRVVAWAAGPRSIRTWLCGTWCPSERDGPGHPRPHFLAPRRSCRHGQTPGRALNRPDDWARTTSKPVARDGAHSPRCRPTPPRRTAHRARAGSLRPRARPARRQR